MPLGNDTNPVARRGYKSLSTSRTSLRTPLFGNFLLPGPLADLWPFRRRKRRSEWILDGTELSW